MDSIGVRLAPVCGTKIERAEQVPGPGVDSKSEAVCAYRAAGRVTSAETNPAPFRASVPLWRDHCASELAQVIPSGVVRKGSDWRCRSRTSCIDLLRRCVPGAAPIVVGEDHDRVRAGAIAMRAAESYSGCTGIHHVLVRVILVAVVVAISRLVSGDATARV